MLVKDDKQDYRKSLLAILDENQLPVNDITETTTLFAWKQDEAITGTAGWEKFGDDAVVRSVSIRKGLQQKGIGSMLYAALEKAATDEGIQDLYLLTTTADQFFSRQGFAVISRDNVPSAIKHSIQFTATCPASAMVMHKSLNQ